jgi:hypothetical protein
MRDDYPPGWTPWLTHDEPPSKPEVPPIDSLRSGAHTDSGDRYTSQPYPQHWRQPSGPMARSQHDEAMAAAASLLVVPNDD